MKHTQCLCAVENVIFRAFEANLLEFANSCLIHNYLTFSSFTRKEIFAYFLKPRFSSMHAGSTSMLNNEDVEIADTVKKLSSSSRVSRASNTARQFSSRRKLA